MPRTSATSPTSIVTMRARTPWQGRFILPGCSSGTHKPDDPIPYALADYNAGRGNVLKWFERRGKHEQPGFRGTDWVSGTRKYIEAVTGRYPGITDPAFKAP